MARATATITALLIFTGLISAIDAGEPNVSRLLELLDQTTFTAFGEQDIDASRQAVLSSIKGIPEELIPREEDEDDYLETQAISNALTENAKDKTEVPDEEVVGRLQNLIEGLEKDTADNDHPELLKLREVARHHVMVVADHHDEKLAASFAERKADLQKALREYAQDPSAQQRRIAAHIRWCQQHGQALKFVAAARQELSSPNLEIRLSADFIREASLRPFEQSEPVNRNSDGIQTRGTSDFRGQGFLRPTNSPGNGMLALEFQGEMQFFATSTRKRIRFGSHATTSVAADARVTFDNQGLMTAGISHVNVRTNLQNSAVNVNWPCELGRQLIGILAELMIAGKSSEVRAELSDGTAQRVRVELNAQLDELLDRANSLRDKVWKRAQRLDLNPSYFSVRTTDTELELFLTEDAVCGLAAPVSNVGAADGSNRVAIHQSLATDLLNRLYLRHIGSRSIDVHSLHRLNDVLSVDVLGETKRGDEQDVNIELLLDDARPFEIGFHENVISLTFRAEQVFLGDNKLPAHNLTLNYRVSLKSDGSVEFDYQGRRLTPLDDAKGEVVPKLVEAIDNELLVDLLPTFALKPNKMKPGGMELPLEIRALTAGQEWLTASLVARRLPIDTSKHISETEPNARFPFRLEAERNIGSRAFLNVYVPAQAVVFLNGRRTKISGETRTYVTRKLKTGLKYPYEIRVEVTRNGHKLSQVKVVDLQAGLTNELTFDFTNAKPVTTSLTLHVPANAKVSLCGVETTARGTTRIFSTTGLNPGDVWSDYKVVVTDVRDGRQVAMDRTLELKAGDDVKLYFDFSRAEGRVATVR